MRVNPDQGLQFAQMLIQDEEPLANINQVAHAQSKAHPETPAKLLWRSPSVLFQMWQKCKEFAQLETPSSLFKATKLLSP